MAIVCVTSKTAARSVCITLKQGLLITNGDADEVEAVQWPTEEEVRTIVQDNYQGRPSNEEGNGTTGAKQWCNNSKAAPTSSGSTMS